MNDCFAEKHALAAHRVARTSCRTGQEAKDNCEKYVRPSGASLRANRPGDASRSDGTPEAPVPLESNSSSRPTTDGYASAEGCVTRTIQ